MLRRRFRQDRRTLEFYELTEDTDQSTHSVIDEIEPFVSPRDGTVIHSRSQLREYMAKHDLVHFDETKGATPEADRYEKGRHDRALREQLWEQRRPSSPHGQRPKTITREIHES